MEEFSNPFPQLSLKNEIIKIKKRSFKTLKMTKVEYFPVLSVQVVRYTPEQIEEQVSSSAEFPVKPLSFKVLYTAEQEFSAAEFPVKPLSIKVVHYTAEEMEQEFSIPTSAPTCAELFPEYNVCQNCKDIKLRCKC